MPGSIFSSGEKLLILLCKPLVRPQLCNSGFLIARIGVAIGTMLSETGIAHVMGRRKCFRGGKKQHPSWKSTSQSYFQSYIAIWVIQSTKLQDIGLVSCSATFMWKSAFGTGLHWEVWTWCWGLTGIYMQAPNLGSCLSSLLQSSDAFTSLKNWAQSNFLPYVCHVTICLLAKLNQCIPSSNEKC